jgi:hypothetical protein
MNENADINSLCYNVSATLPFGHNHYLGGGARVRKAVMRFALAANVAHALQAQLKSELVTG